MKKEEETTGMCVNHRDLQGDYLCEGCKKLLCTECSILHKEEEPTHIVYNLKEKAFAIVREYEKETLHLTSLQGTLDVENQMIVPLAHKLHQLLRETERELLQLIRIGWNAHRTAEIANLAKRGAIYQEMKKMLANKQFLQVCLQKRDSAVPAIAKSTTPQPDIQARLKELHTKLDTAANNFLIKLSTIKTELLSNHTTTFIAYQTGQPRVRKFISPFLAYPPEQTYKHIGWDR